MRYTFLLYSNPADFATTFEIENGQRCPSAERRVLK
jgi:hypothetical protein